MTSRSITVVPGIASVLVPALGLALLVIGARSPYTHSNLLPNADPSYVRTEQIIVGSSVAYQGTSLLSAIPAGTDQLARGKALLVAKGCAGCHGINGEGGVIAPSIGGYNADELRTKTNQGPEGMPVFATRALTDDDLAAIAAYLKSRPSNKED